MLVKAIEPCVVNGAAVPVGETVEVAAEDASLLIRRGQAVMAGPCPAPTAQPHRVVIGDQAAFLSYELGTFGPGTRTVSDEELAALWGKRHVYVPAGGGL